MGSPEPDQIAMTHFTSQAAAAAILDGWRLEFLEQGTDPEFGSKELSLRLYSRYGMNDPTEYLHKPRKVIGRSGYDRLVFPDTAFVHSGARAIEDESIDRLNLWRAYGADGHGIAITTTWSKKGLADDGLEILEVKYVAPEELEKSRQECVALQEQIDEAVDNEEMERARELRRQRMQIEVGYKTDDYQPEHELRIVYYAGDKSGAVSPILKCSAESGRLRAYITRKVKVGIGHTLSGLYVTIGPRVPDHDAEHWKMMVDWTVRQLGLSGSRLTCQSNLAYVG